jgi:SAM-dependent methyltransferase
VTAFHLRTTCRLCDAPTTPAFELTPTPPANELVTRQFVESGEVQDTFPLPVATCNACGHVQLSCVVDPERLFLNYPYRSGASPVFREHLRKYADSVMSRFGKPNYMVEIGSNDGTMLRMFRDKGIWSVGFDTVDLDETNRVVGIGHQKMFFTRKEAVQLRETIDVVPDGHADLIVANHVFAHAEDLRDIALGVRDLLSDDGVFVFEVGYLVDVVEKCLFDTIYHEHLSYHHLRPLVPFFDGLGMTLFDAEWVDTQGGSLRCFVKKNRFEDSDLSKEACRLLDYEKSIGLSIEKVNETVRAMGPRIEKIRIELGDVLSRIKESHASIAGYGAPAKCCTLMHTLGFGPDVLDFIVDDNQVKHGLFTPGKHVEIRPVSALYEERPDYVLVLAWNFADSIITAHPEFKFIVPLPKVELVLPGRRVAM